MRSPGEICPSLGCHTLLHPSRADEETAVKSKAAVKEQRRRTIRRRTRNGGQDKKAAGDEAADDKAADGPSHRDGCARLKPRLGYLSLRATSDGGATGSHSGIASWGWCSGWSRTYRFADCRADGLTEVMLYPFAHLRGREASVWPSRFATAAPPPFIRCSNFEMLVVGWSCKSKCTCV